MLKKLILFMKKLSLFLDKLNEEQKKLNQKEKPQFIRTNINGLPLNRHGVDMEGNIYGTTSSEEE
ncbi:hypothetical protein M8853_00180 [Pasteurella multocida]|uniref:hypothetical protein n=1 Tax=Pasteurella multocida TaxID=747 RepID=UPI000743E3AC|nr:hypothetical protein [Pasteurella multocida]KUM14474.1 hypothetical protein ASV60_06365 [Pasteurella multocida]MCL7758509.1 hypothetical protein [Pasteurella multocida]MCL7821069.1 hypothetical protein [Pasteurella multocida]MCL7821966.1 hypothetical protein [Pasteurella multocida]MCL7826745.1 hypothetical protein [Pasteurella multocida]